MNLYACMCVIQYKWFPLRFKLKKKNKEILNVAPYVILLNLSNSFVPACIDMGFVVCLMAFFVWNCVCMPAKINFPLAGKYFKVCFNLKQSAYVISTYQILI